MEKNNIQKDNFIFELMQSTQKGDLNYIYRGQFSQDISHYILSLAEKNIHKTKLSARTRKRVFHIMVESIQNITRHQEVPESDPTIKAIFSIQKNNSIYYVTTGNLIEHHNIPDLKRKLDKVNSLDKKELTKFYREILSDGKISAKGGAGLGLIEIVRKSGNKLFYDFKKIDDKFSFFYQHTYIQTEEDDNKKLDINDKSYVFSFEYIKNVHKLLNNENILLIYSSLFDQPSLLSLISILDSQMKGRLVFKKKVISTMVELLQNIIHHGDTSIDNINGSQGIFYISRDKNKFYLNTINYMKNSDIENLDNKLKHINSLDKDSIENFYNEQLFDFDQEHSHGGGGLGFIEMKRKSNNKLIYNFQKVNDYYSFFTLKILFIT